MSDLTSIIADQNQQIDAENHENSSKSEELLKSDSTQASVSK
jgi:hypothetical protein